MKLVFVLLLTFAASALCSDSNCVLCGAPCPSACWSAITAKIKCDEGQECEIDLGTSLMRFIKGAPECQSMWAGAADTAVLRRVLKTAYRRMRRDLKKGNSAPERGYLVYGIGQHDNYCDICETADNTYCSQEGRTCQSLCKEDTGTSATSAPTYTRAPAYSRDDSDDDDRNGEEDELLKLLNTKDRTQSWQCW